MNYITVEIDARNVLFSTASQNFLKKLEEKAQNPQVKKYIKSNLTNWLINNYKGKLHNKVKSTDPDWVSKALGRGDEIFDINITPADEQKFEHWIDYLNIVDKPERIKNISVPDLINHVKKWEESFQKAKDNEEDGIKDIYTYSNGYKWVEVFGEKSLNREGKLMNHCVGSYCNLVKEEKTKIYSLRDENNKPHITIEFDLKSKKIEQIKGNSNQAVKPEYLQYLNDLIEHKRIPFGKINDKDLLKNGLIFINDKIYNISELPEGTEINGDLDLSSLKVIKLVTKLPENLKIDGNLDLSYNKKITELPKGLEVGGKLNLYKSVVTKLPENLKVGELVLHNTNIEELPKGLEVKDKLSLSSSKVTKLPENLKVMGNLYLNNKITELPKGLEVGGNLYLTKKLVLPKDLNVKGKVLVKKRRKVLTLNDIASGNYGDYEVLAASTTNIIRKNNMLASYILHQIKGVTALKKAPVLQSVQDNGHSVTLAFTVGTKPCQVTLNDLYLAKLNKKLTKALASPRHEFLKVLTKEVVSCIKDELASYEPSPVDFTAPVAPEVQENANDIANNMFPDDPNQLEANKPNMNLDYIQMFNSPILAKLLLKLFLSNMIKLKISVPDNFQCALDKPQEYFQTPYIDK